MVEPGWRCGPRTQAVWQTKIFLEEHRLWRQLCCKIQNFKAWGITLGSWEEPVKLLPEYRDKRGWMKRMRSDLLSIHLTSHPMFLPLHCDTETELIRIPLLLPRLRTFLNHMPIYLERESHTKKAVYNCGAAQRHCPICSHSRAITASHVCNEKSEAKPLFPLNPFGWS